MVLINLDALSDSELRCVAKQEHLEGWEKAERIDLIDELREKYEDGEPQGRSTVGGPDVRRFCTSLTDCGSTRSPGDNLPGVEGLPRNYNQTSIHLLMRDPLWVYAYWSIAPQTMNKIFGDDGGVVNLFLRVHMSESATGKRSFFDIGVTRNDREWNINLPEIGYRYKVDLSVRKAGVERVLAESAGIETERCYWEGHWEEIASDSDLFSVQVSSFLSSRGEGSSNMMLRSLSHLIGKGVLA